MAGNAFANTMGLPAEVILAIAGQGGGGGGGEPSAYIKSASVSGNKLTLTKKDGSKVEFDMTTVVNTINASIAALQTSVAGKQDTISDLSTIRDRASNGNLAYNRLSNDVNYIEMEVEDSDTHEVTTFKIFGYEVEEGGGV